MEEEQEMDATERSRTECNRHDGPMVAAFRSVAVGGYPSITSLVPQSSSASGPLIKLKEEFTRRHHLIAYCIQ